MADTRSSDDYDSPWKEALTTYFPECLSFFFPKAAEDIDWTEAYHFLDKELQQIAPKAPRIQLPHFRPLSQKGRQLCHPG